MTILLTSLKNSIREILPKPVTPVAQSGWQLARRFANKILCKIRHPGTVILYPKIQSTGQYNQPEILDYLLGEMEFGFFIDIGANHPEHNSNSYHFETMRRYRGIAFDPLQKYAELWKSRRPNTKFENLALGGSEGEITFVEHENRDGWQDQLSFTSDSPLFDSASMTGKRVRVMRLDEVKGVPQDADFLSLDVEGAELAVLNGFGKNIRPKLLLVENCFGLAGKQEIRDVVTSMGYIFLFRISYIDDLYVRNDQLEIQERAKKLPAQLSHLITTSCI